MPRPLAPAECDALLPLLEIAQGMPATDREAFLDDLRTDAPTVVGCLERLLTDHATGTPGHTQTGASPVGLPVSGATGTLTTRAQRPSRASVVSRSVALLAACLSPLLKIR